MLASGSVQEVMDFGLLAQVATLESRVPLLHFFDGWRTSSEIQKIDQISFEIMREMISEEAIAAHRDRALNPEHPTIRGTSQNPDVFFTARETVNKYYLNAPGIVEAAMARLTEYTGRSYRLFDYTGVADAERVIVIMGSGAETAEETALSLNTQGAKVGVIKVRLFRPFSTAHLAKALPPTVKKIAVLDRTKEPGSVGEPLYQDIRTAIGEVADSGEAPFHHRYP